MRRILSYKKYVLWAAVLTVAGCAIVAVVFLTNPEPQEDNALSQPTDMSESGTGDAGLSGIGDADLLGVGDVDSSGPSDADNLGTETQSSDNPEQQNTAEPEPEYITGPEIDTGYPEYDALIAEVQEILLDYHNLDIYPGEEKEDYFWPELLWVQPQSLGYMTRDLDGNGVKELIFGENGSDAWNGVMYQLYTIADGKVICIFVGGSRSRYYLCDNGCIANEGASSAFECEESYYTYKGTELTLIETVIYDFGKMLYSTEYPYYLEEYPPEVYQDITEEEIEEIEAKYVYEQPQLTPFVELLPVE